MLNIGEKTCVRRPHRPKHLKAVRKLERLSPAFSRVCRNKCPHGGESKRASSARRVGLRGRSAQYRGRTRLWVAGYKPGSARRVSPRRHRRHPADGWTESAPVREESANPAAPAPRGRGLRITIDRPASSEVGGGTVGLRGRSALGSCSTADVRGCGLARNRQLRHKKGGI